MTPMLANIIAAVALAIWLYLLLGHGGFWRSSERDDGHAAPVGSAPPVAWPNVAIVIPARDEAEGIGESVPSLLGQDYPGDWSIILVDDASSDATAAIARRAAAAVGSEAR